MRWTQKPSPGFYDVDWRHPSAAKLLIYLPLTDGVLTQSRNEASPTLIGSVSGAVPSQVVSTLTGRFGYGVHTQSAGNAAVSNPNNVNAAAGDFMLRLLIRPVTWTSGFTAIVDKAKGTGGNVDREMSLFVDTSGNLSYYNIGTGFGFITISTGMTTGQDWDFVWARKGSTHTAYVNGAAKGTWSDGNTTANGTNTSWTFGANPSTGGSDGDVIYAGIQFWQRAPYIGEVLALYNDPFGMLRPRNQRRYAIRLASRIIGPFPTFRPDLLSAN